MLPKTTLALCFMAAVAGGVTARYLPSSAPVAPVSGAATAQAALQAAQMATDAALPARAEAATSRTGVPAVMTAFVDR
jgi:hypothetical protein